MESERAQRRLAAIVMTDVVGFSRLVRQDEAGTLAAVRRLREDVLGPIAERHHGRIVKSAGDGFLIEFASAVDAVEASLALQQELLADPQGLAMRVGVNLGDVVVEGNDVMGDGVNVAARLESIAEPGCIYLSSSIYEQIEDKIDAQVKDLGPQILKNIDRPVHVYSIGEASQRAGVGADPGSGGIPVLAVLPFTNMSGSDDEFFSDGLTEDIITEMSRFRDCRVISRNSTFRYKGRAIDVGEVARELGATYVVEGSCRRAGNRLRVTAQLIEAAADTHLWADRYDRDIADVFEVQDELTRTIASTLGVRVQDAALERTLAKPTADLDAYDCVVKARRFTVALDAERHAEARDLLERAIELDPGYADAYALLANVYLAEYRIDLNPRPDPVGRAMAMAQRAIELDPQNAYAHCWLAIVHFFRRENERFVAEANRALALNPNDPETLADIAHYYTYMGQTERGCELMAQAIELNPLHPGWYHFTFARHHYQQRDYKAVLADIERIDMPEFYWSHLLRAAALGQLGDPGATQAADQMLSLKPDLDARAELLKWNTAYDDLEHLLEGLEKAGIQVT